MTDSPTLVRTHETLPMSVANMAFLVDRLSEDCSPLQFLRELTKNSIEAIQLSCQEFGEIRWDLDWKRFDLREERVSKLSIIDTGIGMTGPEMVQYINMLSSSIHQQSKTGNFGVGAKISAAPMNPEGLVYLSWKDGKGSMIHLHKDATEGVYGLSRFRNGEFWQHITDDIKPEPIENHGTMVVLLGHSPDEDTVVAPPKVPMPRKWILRYLNSRFYRFPPGVAVKVREGWDLPRGHKHNFLRTVTGQGPWLDDNSSDHGTLRLDQTKATVYWWIIKETADTNSGHYAPGGHVAGLFQDELYELVYGPAGYARLQAFGVVFGCDRVALYVEPDNDPSEPVTANTARTSLAINNNPLDWPAYAAEFREVMPDELREYQDALGLQAANTDHRKAIEERLNTIRELFRFGRYRPYKDGIYKMTDSSDNTGGEPAKLGSKQAGSSGGGGVGGAKGDIYSLFSDEVGEPADKLDSLSPPEVSWISVENGTRTQGDLEDRAARYLSEQNRLMVNADFRAFTDMVDRWTARYENVAGSEGIITQTVREWFEQQLIETIMSAWALHQHGKWSTDEVRHLWDEAALTAAVLPRYHIDVSIKRSLGQRIGKVRSAA